MPVLRRQLDLSAVERQLEIFLFGRHKCASSSPVYCSPGGVYFASSNGANIFAFIMQLI